MSNVLLTDISLSAIFYFELAVVHYCCIVHDGDTLTRSFPPTTYLHNYTNINSLYPETSTFNFSNNSVKNQPILIIFCQ